MLPKGADAVVQIERTTLDDDVVIPTVDVETGDNVRRVGDDLRAGQTVLRAGRRIGPVEIGAAAAAGAGVLSCALRRASPSSQPATSSSTPARHFARVRSTSPTRCR
jgi:molybdopterin biosynthesis enzyme